jgi:Arc/MetJ family transcription regulator
MCDILHIKKVADMATNLAIDDALIDEARRVGNHKTKREAVTAALDEYIRWRKQLKILDHFGTIDFDSAYDYKRMRRLDRIETEAQ